MVLTGIGTASSLQTALALSLASCLVPHVKELSKSKGSSKSYCIAFHSVIAVRMHTHVSQWLSGLTADEPVLNPTSIQQVLCSFCNFRWICMVMWHLAVQIEVSPPQADDLGRVRQITQEKEALAQQRARAEQARQVGRLPMILF